MSIVRTGTTCIYEIRNTLSDRRYVGSSDAPFGRFNGHYRQLTENRHTNGRLQQDWNHSKVSDWTFRLLETAVPIDCKITREGEWIQRLRPFYNIKQISRSELAREEKIEMILRLRQKGLQYRQIAEQTGVSLGSISYVMKRYTIDRKAA